MEVFARALPEVGQAELYWRFKLVVGVLTYILADTDLTGGYAEDLSDVDGSAPGRLPGGGPAGSCAGAAVAGSGERRSILVSGAEIRRARKAGIPGPKVAVLHPVCPSDKSSPSGPIWLQRLQSLMQALDEQEKRELVWLLARPARISAPCRSPRNLHQIARQLNK